MRYAEVGSEIHLVNLSDRSHRRLKGHHKSLREVGAKVDDGGISHRSPRQMAAKFVSRMKNLGSKKEKNVLEHTTKGSDSSRNDEIKHHVFTKVSLVLIATQEIIFIQTIISQKDFSEIQATMKILIQQLWIRYP